MGRMSDSGKKGASSEGPADSGIARTRGRARLGGRRWWPWAVGAVSVAVPAVPPAVFAAVADDPNWGQFWTAAAAPYGTMAAGLAALSAAAIAFHNGSQQRNFESGKMAIEHDAATVRNLRERFTTATQQFAAEQHMIRQAGAYALAALADDWLARGDIKEAQVCVDLLCNYLRTAPEREPVAAQLYGPPVDQDIRLTILSIIKNHLGERNGHSEECRPGAWTSLRLDFSGAYLHDCADIFSRAAFGEVSFDRATFTGETSFDETGFGAASFDDATFYIQDRYNGFNYEGYSPGALSFGKAKFDGPASFKSARFGTDSSIDDPSSIDELHVVYFDSVIFSDGAIFRDAKFQCSVKFEGAVFAGEANFESLTAGSGIDFRTARFDAEVSFKWAELGPVDFSKAVFSAETNFRFASFIGTADLAGAIFLKRPDFSQVEGLPKNIMDVIAVRENPAATEQRTEGDGDPNRQGERTVKNESGLQSKDESDEARGDGSS